MSRYFQSLQPQDSRWHSVGGSRTVSLDTLVTVEGPLTVSVREDGAIYIGEEAAPYVILEDGAELVFAWGGDGMVRRCVGVIAGTDGQGRLPGRAAWRGGARAVRAPARCRA